MNTKCGRCGLKLREHTDMKCSEIIRLERDALFTALQEVSDRDKVVKATLLWVKGHKAHEIVKNDPLMR